MHFATRAEFEMGFFHSWPLVPSCSNWELPLYPFYMGKLVVWTEMFEVMTE